MVYTYMQGDEMQSLVREEPLTPQHTTTIRVHAPDNVCLLLYTGKPSTTSVGKPIQLL